jgi:hypothetical protein
MINKRSLKALLNNSKESLEWKSVEENHISIKWLPILEIEEFDGDVGLSSEGDWLFVKQGSLKFLDNVDNFFVIHPLLIKDRTEVIKQFRASLKNLGLPDVVITTFPFDKLIVSAIHYPSIFERVIDWLNKGYPPNDMIAEAFSKVGLTPTAIRRWQDDRLKKITQI